MAHVCTKCNGDGIIGNGANPADQEGKVITCDACQGTGRVAEEPVETPKGVVSEPVPEEVKEEVVDEVKTDASDAAPTE